MDDTVISADMVMTKLNKLRDKKFDKATGVVLDG